MTKPIDVAAAPPSLRAQFHSAFPQLTSAILDEWPQLDAESLAAANADLDKVVALLVEKTGHTKALIRRQLEEILYIVTTPVDAGVRVHRGTVSGFARDTRAAAATVNEAAHEALHSVEEILEQFEKRTRPLLRELRGNVLTEARDKVREHWLLSLLGTLGLGFLVGVLFSLCPKAKQEARK
jgi:hypothetical protein